MWSFMQQLRMKYCCENCRRRIVILPQFLTTTIAVVRGLPYLENIVILPVVAHCPQSIDDNCLKHFIDKDHIDEIISNSFAENEKMMR